VGDSIPLDADRRVAQRDIVQRQLTEVVTALPHDHWHQVDGDRVEQAELEALPGDGAGRHGHGALVGDGLRLRDRGLHPVGDEVKRSSRVCLHPGRRNLVGHDDPGTPIVCVPPHPSVKSNKVRPHTRTPSPCSHCLQYAALEGLM